MDDGRVDDRRLMGDEQLQEVIQPVIGPRIERVDMGAVGEGEPLAAGSVKCWTRSGQWPPVCSSSHWQAMNVGTSILLTKLTGSRGSASGVVSRVFLDLLVQIRGLAVKGLVGRAGLIPGLDPFIGPRLAHPGTGRFGVLLALFGPGDCEAGVEDSAGVERRGRCVDRRERRDRLEAGRLQLRGEELADCAVGDPEHADLVTEDPGLVGDRFDHVVAIEILQRLEEVDRRRPSSRSPACSRRPRRSPSGWRGRRCRFPGRPGWHSRSRSTRSASGREACSHLRPAGPENGIPTGHRAHPRGSSAGGRRSPAGCRPWSSDRSSRCRGFPGCRYRGPRAPLCPCGRSVHRTLRPWSQGGPRSLRRA